MKVIKISDHVYDKIKELAEKRQVSINNMVEEILNVYLSGNPSENQPIKQIIEKNITLSYKSKCKKCSRELQEGEIAHYIKYVYQDNSVRSTILCLDCYYQSGALAKYYITKKQFELIVRGLKAEADRLVEEINRLQSKLEIAKIQSLIKDIINKAYEIRYIDVKLVNEKDQAMKLLFEISESLRDIIERLNKIEAQLVIPKEREKKKEIYAKL